MKKKKSFNKKYLGATISGLILATIVILVDRLFYYGGLSAKLFYPVNFLLFDVINIMNLRNCGESCWGILMLIGNIETLIFFPIIVVLVIFAYEKIKQKL